MEILRRTLGSVAVSILAAVVWYIIFSLIFSTDVEKELIRENRTLSGVLPDAEMAAALVEDELDFLRMRDENVYKQVFKSELPDFSVMHEGKPQDPLASAGRAEDNWKAVFSALKAGKTLPPLVLPLDGVNYTNVGASVGYRINPFYKVKARHDGIDLVASEGTPVHAPASGRVSKVQNSYGGKGNMVEITHSGGYVTRYAHLLETDVKEGQSVKKGEVVGRVGDSGRAFTTHLHYEILHNGKVQDPVHFFFGSLMPEDYMSFLVMSVSSGQSMD